MKKLIAIYGILLAPAGFVTTGNAAEQIPGVEAKPNAYFYTGKPYDKDLGVYVFSARDYNPEVNRWTSADPSGFPDGANNRIYAPVPTSCIDPTGETSIPTAQAFWFGYLPVDYNNMTPKQVWSDVGGHYNDRYLAGDPDYADDTCALRVSIALDSIQGQSIPATTPGADTDQGGNAAAGTEYLLAATSMGNYLSGAWGQPISIAEGADNDNLSYIQGLLQPGWIAVCVMPGQHVGVVTGSDYGNYNDPYTPQGNAAEIWILE